MALVGIVEQAFDSIDLEPARFNFQSILAASYIHPTPDLGKTAPTTDARMPRAIRPSVRARVLLLGWKLIRHSHTHTDPSTQLIKRYGRFL